MFGGVDGLYFDLIILMMLLLVGIEVFVLDVIKWWVDNMVNELVVRLLDDFIVVEVCWLVF